MSETILMQSSHSVADRSCWTLFTRSRMHHEMRESCGKCSAEFTECAVIPCDSSIHLWSNFIPMTWNVLSPFSGAGLKQMNKCLDFNSKNLLTYNLSHLLPNLVIAFSRVVRRPSMRFLSKGNSLSPASLFRLPAYVRGAMICVKHVMMTGSSMIPSPTISRVGMRERTSIFDDAWGFHMPYALLSKFDFPVLPFDWLCRVEFNSVITSFNTVDSPTITRKDCQYFHED